MIKALNSPVLKIFAGTLMLAMIAVILALVLVLRSVPMNASSQTESETKLSIGLSLHTKGMLLPSAPSSQN